ncbi:ATP-binding cassette domain-containing protein [Labedaea rhizosphaerae]|uniref:ABC-2 type transport system ATP-binding protein n=1 Tax=Labedaea rhizosphaerae TaxID=598644 RepID=A0A4R6RY34_LABRH|nr:ATP-binding cassette domain-containing protein [Labedaea rhizosphaerae]TDP91136.1 ABC-2 type transport system ATP-binding protein [Labedaea rhizosphaerae]
MPAIEATGLVKRYGADTALAGLDLAVPEGTVCGLLGPNGAGKTTAVRILTTLLRPDAGHATVAGIDVVKDPAKAKAALGLVGQHAAVDEVLSGRENLQLFGRLHHLGARTATRRADELLAAFGLTDAATKSVRHYSGGMRRRLDLAAGLITEPRVLFLDEPTTGLDPRSRAEIWSAVRDLVRRGTTVLLTTQYLEEADQLADRIALLDHGRLAAEGTSDELKAVLGGDRVEVLLVDQSDVDEAAHLLAVPGLEVDRDAAKVSIPATDRVDTLSGVIRTLADAAIPAQDIAIRRPTLDEVFLHLTATEVPA